VEVYSRSGQATDSSVAHAYCMLDTKRFKHTFRISSNYCFYNSALSARTRLIVTLYVFCLSSDI